MKKIYLLLIFVFILAAMVPIFLSRIIPLLIGLLSLLFSYSFKPNFSAGKEYKEWMLIWGAFILLSTIWSISPWLTIYTIFINVLPIFLVTYSLARYIDSYGKLIDILKLLYIGGCISLIYLVLFVDLAQIAGNRLSAAITDEGLAETWNVNAIGMNFSLSILFGYLICKYAKKKFFWFIWIIITLIMLIAIMLTGSRKAILLLMIPFFIFALYDYKRHMLKAYGLLFLAFGLVWLTLNVPFFYDIIGHRIEDMINILTGNETGHEDNSRKYLILLGLDWFSQRPFLGYGMNCFRVLSDTVPRFAGLNFYAHNNYVEILVGGGLIGFSVYYSYIIFLLRRIYHHRSLFFRYAAIIMAIVLVMDFAQVSYYDTIMQILIVLAFILVRLYRIESHRKVVG